MLRKLRERASVMIVKNPSRSILLFILLINILLFVVSAAVISLLAPPSLAYSGFWASVFYTVSMVLDAGCIQFVIEDIGQASVALILVCMFTVIAGMIIFTGAVIGYVTNYISGFIENSRSGLRSIKTSGHTVILNWNNRASEIFNDLLYSGRRETIIVISDHEPDEIEREIHERLSDTLGREKAELLKKCARMSPLSGLVFYLRGRLRNRLTVIVRQGDTYSTKQLSDVSISQAKTVILLNNDITERNCKYDLEDLRRKRENGNANTVKTLVQVAEMTSAEDSRDDQVIVVEVEDNWTLTLVRRIIARKEKLGKCNIIPVPVNMILGQVLSQFSIMPELNTVYSSLFSNKGAEFFCLPHDNTDEENALIARYMDTHSSSIPLTVTETKTGTQAFFIAEKERDFYRPSYAEGRACKVDINSDYWIEQKNIVILGHNSMSGEIMNGFNGFRSEWNYSDGREILNIMVIDDKKSLEKHGYYKNYPYVKKVVEAELQDNELIFSSINDFVNENSEDTSVLILSDDTVAAEDIDSSALTYLIYVQDIISYKLEHDPGFKRERIDIVVEIINPKNYDVVHNYSVNNVVISNRYISKMVTQIGRKQALYDFYQDILTYDEGDASGYDSKEIYIKKASSFFKTLPPECTARELIRGVFDATPENNKAIVIGYVTVEGDVTMFTGEQEDINVKLRITDKLIVFGNH